MHVSKCEYYTYFKQMLQNTKLCTMSKIFSFLLLKIVPLNLPQIFFPTHDTTAYFRKKHENTKEKTMLPQLHFALYSFIQCAWCKKCVCFSCFYDRYHPQHFTELPKYYARLQMPVARSLVWLACRQAGPRTDGAPKHSLCYFSSVSLANFI